MAADTTTFNLFKTGDWLQEAPKKSTVSSPKLSSGCAHPMAGEEGNPCDRLHEAQVMQLMTFQACRGARDSPGKTASSPSASLAWIFHGWARMKGQGEDRKSVSGELGALPYL